MQQMAAALKVQDGEQGDGQVPVAKAAGEGAGSAVGSSSGGLEGGSAAAVPAELAAIEDKITVSDEVVKQLTALAANMFTVQVEPREQRIAAKLAAEENAKSAFPVGLSVRFTPCGAKGATGPSLEQVKASLGEGNPLKQLIRVNDGIISFPSIPTGTYRVICAGKKHNDRCIQSCVQLISPCLYCVL